MKYWTQSEKNIYVAAHRGWCGKYPENTMAAFKGALELDIDQIETDVRVTKDGELYKINPDFVYDKLEVVLDPDKLRCCRLIEKALS